jgi:SAM-dependent methyltransferase
MNAQQWVETPMFMMRRDCVARASSSWAPGHFLEIGAGTGALTKTFLTRGFTGVCYDLGETNRRLLRKNLAEFDTAIDVVEGLTTLVPETFDYLFAFEVLEHIEADADALNSWVRFVKPGGRIVVSVPAHSRKFNDEDRAVGHYRRYERRQLEQLLAAAGCTTTRILSYGFPLAVLTRRGNQVLRRFVSPAVVGQSTQESLSIRSGVERSHASIRLSGFLTRRTLAPLIVLQRAFFGTDWGDGYVAEALYRPKFRPSAVRSG